MERRIARLMQNAGGAAGQAAAILMNLNCRIIRFAGANTDNLLDLAHKNLAVTNLAGIGRFYDRLNHRIQHR